MPPWMFHVATLSDTVVTAARWISGATGASTAMSELPRLRRAAVACTELATQHPDQREDQRDGEDEQCERSRSRMAHGGDRAVDEERHRRHAGKQSDERAEHEIAPPDVRCARDDVDDGERRNGNHAHERDGDEPSLREAARQVVDPLPRELAHRFTPELAADRKRERRACG